MKVRGQDLKKALGLRIAKTKIIFQKIDPFFGHHEAEEDDALKCKTILGQSFLGRQPNVSIEVFFHEWRIMRIWGNTPHSPCIKSCFSWSDFLVVHGGP